MVSIVKFKCKHVVDKFYWAAIFPINSDEDDSSFKDSSLANMTRTELKTRITHKIISNFPEHNSLKKFHSGSTYSEMFLLVDDHNIYDFSQYKHCSFTGPVYLLATRHCTESECSRVWPSHERLAHILKKNFPNQTLTFVVGNIEKSRNLSENNIKKIINEYLNVEMVFAKQQILAELNKEISLTKIEEDIEMLKDKQEKMRMELEEDLDKKYNKLIANLNNKEVSIVHQSHGQTDKPMSNRMKDSVQTGTLLTSSSTLKNIDEPNTNKLAKIAKHLPKTFFDKCGECEKLIDNDFMYVSFECNKGKSCDLTTLCDDCVNNGVHYHRIMLRLPRQVAYRPTAVHTMIENVLRSFKKTAAVTEHKCVSTCPLGVKSKKENDVDYNNIAKSLNEVEKLTELMMANRAKIVNLDSAVEKSFPKMQKTFETFSQEEVQPVLPPEDLTESVKEEKLEGDVCLTESITTTEIKDEVSMIGSIEVLSTISADEYELLDDIAYPSSENPSRSISMQESEYEDADLPDENMFVSTTTTVIGDESNSIKHAPIEQSDNKANSEPREQEECVEEDEEGVEKNVNTLEYTECKQEVMIEEPIIEAAQIPSMVIGSERNSPTFSDKEITTADDDDGQNITTSETLLSSSRFTDELLHGIDVASSAINNVAIQVGRAVTLKHQNWSPPPPQNPFKKLAKGATPDQYTGWAPKSTQTGEINQHQIPDMYRTDLIDIDESIGRGLAVILGMGFDDVRTIVKALRDNNGDVEHALKQMLGD